MDLPNLQQQNGMLLLTKYGEGDENYSTIKFETELIKPFLCDYSDAYILVAGIQRLEMAMQILKLHLKIYGMCNSYKL